MVGIPTTQSEGKRKLALTPFGKVEWLVWTYDFVRMEKYFTDEPWGVLYVLHRHPTNDKVLLEPNMHTLICTR